MAEQASTQAIYFYVTDQIGNLTRLGPVSERSAPDVVRVIMELTTDRTGHGNDKAVIVLEVDEDKLGKSIEKHGAKHFEKGDRFDSAMAASLRLGFKDNQVSMALGKARRLEEHRVDTAYGPGSSEKMKLRPKAALRGVTFQYVEHYDPDAEDNVRI